MIRHLDLLVFGIYLVVVFTVGIYVSRKDKGADEYFSSFVIGLGFPFCIRWVQLILRNQPYQLSTP